MSAFFPTLREFFPLPPITEFYVHTETPILGHWRAIWIMKVVKLYISIVPVFMALIFFTAHTTACVRALNQAVMWNWFIVPLETWVRKFVAVWFV